MTDSDWTFLHPDINSPSSSCSHPTSCSKLPCAEQPVLCLCAPSTEIRTSLGTNTQPLFMLCHFHTFLFFFKALFLSQFSKFPAQVTPVRAAGLGLGEGGIAGAGTPLLAQVFTLQPPPLWRNSKADLERRARSSQSCNSTFLCRREMKMYLDDKLGDNLEKQRGFASQIKSQNEKTRLGITKTPLWRQSSHHPWTETRNSEPLVVILEISKPSRETKRWQNFPISHPLGVTVLQNSNKVV